VVGVLAVAVILAAAPVLRLAERAVEPTLL
jgi:hypothetical protein